MSKHALSRKQAAIMCSIVDDGKQIHEVAEEKGMSPSTVSTHLFRIKVKLGAKTLTQAAAIFAVQRIKEAI